MKPVKFPGHNVVMGEHQPQYQPLPAFRETSIEGRVVTCWKMTFKERLKVLFWGRLYLMQLTFNCALQPLLPSIDNPVTIVETTD